MTREDVEKAALNTLNSFDVEYIYHKDYASKESFCEGFMMGAEWMREQHKNLDVHTDNTEVIANLQAEVERLKTEKLNMIHDACKFLCDTCPHWTTRCEIVKCDKPNSLRQSMKGECNETDECNHH